MTYTTTFSRPALVALAISAMTVLCCPSARAAADLEDLPLAPENYWNGSDGSGGFTSGGIDFVNNYNETYGSWDSWAYSNTTDTTTADYTNQYSAYTGGGQGGSSNYGVYYQPFSVTPTITGIAPGGLNGAYITNTTYAALSMRDGDEFAKQFGGDDGTDPDWFLLTIEGVDANGDQVDGSVEFYLADYRFSDDSQDYIVDTWEWVDMSSLGNATELQFTLTSTDNGDFGMNTPAYFAMDGLVVPEPASVLLLLAGATLLLGRRRRAGRAPRDQ